ncbi:hypothetical protein J4E90_009248 [Alternaria incomplexa]|uniref:uncharacterized protein n=1 Tax=Alternaria incomplexa TaxID=1187928 RepID=UPI002220CC5D|nr:uncharacterized protein J4E90_009248 [Alternaria incomplexa]KAI4907840.1 hypothetical protein J4E90_009248 [Alternaria incomplexa]
MSPVADSSPLSELPETPSLEVSSAMRGNDGRVEALKNDDGEESADESSDTKKPYACQYCGKTYVSEAKLKQGLACTKHKEQVSDCNPELLTDTPTQPYKLAPRSSRAGTVAKDDKGKRKATDSPVASPKSKPVAKRATAVAKKETTTATGPSQDAGRLYPPFASQSDLERSPQYHMDIEENTPQALDEHRTQFNHVHSPESRLTRFRPIQSANFKVYEEAARRNIRPNEFLASAPGSRMPSRQTSAQPAADLNLPTQGQLQGINTAASTTKGPVAHKLTEPIALQRSALPVADENDPIMTLRIHSNTYDINGTPIFSILTIRASQKFGPRLEYYCQQRGKQYDIDWVFIYQYALGGPDDDVRDRYIKIDYNMTFSDVYDPERPDIKLRDMDTIMIMKAKSRLATMIDNGRRGIETPLSPTGSQISEDNIDIVDGETPIFQNAGTIANWNRIVESKMMELRSQVNTLTSENQRQKTELARQNQMLGDMIKRNDASLRSSHPQATGRGVHAFPFVGHSAANLHPGIQRGPTVQRNAFMDRLEAVREPTVLNDSRNRMQQYQFPTHHPGMQGRRPTYDSGEREAFPDFQRIGAATTQPIQFAAYGMGDEMNSYAPVLQHVQGGSDDMGAPVMKVEDVEMEE